MAKTNKISATKTVKELWEGITDTPAAKRVSTI
jgi:hypothetical protein